MSEHYWKYLLLLNKAWQLHLILLMIYVKRKPHTPAGCVWEVFLGHVFAFQWSQEAPNCVLTRRLGLTVDMGLSRGSSGFVASGTCHELPGRLMCIMLNHIICPHDHMDLNWQVSVTCKVKVNHVGKETLVGLPFAAVIACLSVIRQGTLKGVCCVSRRNPLHTKVCIV